MRVAVSGSHYERSPVDFLVHLRRSVDALLREMLLDDAWGFGVSTLEVRGDPAERARQVTCLVSSCR
jgi:hypothetical protein